MNGIDIATQFYSNNKQTESLDGLDTVSKYGTLTPMIHIRSIYHGAHGSTDYNASIQTFIAKAIFKEKPSSTPDLIVEDDDEEEYLKYIYIYK